MSARQRQELLGAYPYFKYLAAQRMKKAYRFRRNGRCWFLGQKGECSIEKRFGYSSKPLMCRVYPFNVAPCNKEYVIVPEICPTLSLNADKVGKASSHKTIHKQAREAIDNDCLNPALPWTHSRLDLEKMILADSGYFLSNYNYLDFAALQISLTKKEKISKIKSRLWQKVGLWKAFLDIRQLDMDNQRLTHTLTAITSLLRVRLFSPLERMPEEEIPLALLALYFYRLLFSRVRESAVNLDAYPAMLADIVLGIVYLKKGDLNLKFKSLEERINHLRILQGMYAQRALPGRRSRGTSRSHFNNSSVISSIS